ncbi:Fructokinase [Pontiella desulfatans]|uniref:Fructokinase n=1 Tax=Pontiella desulfatans TaxID=2750659 RepID=A0A6C2TYB1_PONDE|nr:carbohydrate kinase [Pontiella desulfatans]VGO12585.1 Fructokinase [Pontiella desulfatans]
MNELTVIGIGELLWDMFPEGKRLGGAPMNFCYHCQQLGAKGYPVSAVGSDVYGADILDFLVGKQVTADFVAVDDVHPTGTVDVTVDKCGKPAYVIKEQVAWDYIPLTGEMLSLAHRADAVCFGSLAQRNGMSNKTIRTFLAAMKPESIRIFDVNLRQQYYTEEIIRESLNFCNILKLSDEELPVLAKMFRISGTVEWQLKRLRKMFDLDVVVYTRGPAGSLLISSEGISDHPGYPGDALNSVGAGDSFTATLCMGLLCGMSLDGINAHANRVATFVCSQDSATPELPDDLKGTIYA